MPNVAWGLIRVVCMAAGVVLACGGTTRQSVDDASAGAPTGGAINSSGASAVTSAGTSGLGGVGSAAASNGGATAGAPLPVDAPMCFEPDELPADWYADNAGGASARECPVGTTGTFGIGSCYFQVSDIVPTSSPPGQEAECCYWLRTFHCR